jgi:hypothetical protein
MINPLGLLRQAKIKHAAVHPDYRLSFGGSINSVFRKEYSTKSHVSCTRLCPVLPYRATYYRNIIIYKILRICQEGHHLRDQFLVQSINLSFFKCWRGPDSGLPDMPRNR